VITSPASRPVLEAARGPAAASRAKALTGPRPCAAGAGRLTFAATSPKPAPAPTGPPASAQTRKPDPPGTARPAGRTTTSTTRPLLTNIDHDSGHPAAVKTRKHPRSVLASKIRPLLLGSTPISRQPVSSARLPGCPPSERTIPRLSEPISLRSPHCGAARKDRCPGSPAPPAGSPWLAGPPGMVARSPPPCRGRAVGDAARTCTPSGRSPHTPSRMGSGSADAEWPAWPRRPDTALAQAGAAQARRASGQPFPGLGRPAGFTSTEVVYGVADPGVTGLP